MTPLIIYTFALPFLIVAAVGAMYWWTGRDHVPQLAINDRGVNAKNLVPISQAARQSRPAKLALRPDPEYRSPP